MFAATPIARAPNDDRPECFIAFVPRNRRRLPHGQVRPFAYIAPGWLPESISVFCPSAIDPSRSGR